MKIIEQTRARGQIDDSVNDVLARSQEVEGNVSEAGSGL
jgi:hypothetical protein